MFGPFTHLPFPPSVAWPFVVLPVEAGAALGFCDAERAGRVADGLIEHALAYLVAGVTWGVHSRGVWFERPGLGCGSHRNHSTFVVVFSHQCFLHVLDMIYPKLTIDPFKRVFSISCVLRHGPQSWKPKKQSAIEIMLGSFSLGAC